MKTDRDIAIIALRPTTPLIDEAVQALEEELGQAAPDTLAYMLHATLRSILKLQHNVILRLTAFHAMPHRGALLQKSIKDQCAFLTTTMKKDTALRMLIIGVVVGQFTEAELMRYTVNMDDKAEINKRIIELAAKRVCDSREEVLAMMVR